MQNWTFFVVTFWRIFFAHEIWRAIIEIRLFFQIVLGEHLIGAYGAGPFENSGTFNIFFWPLSYQVHLILYEKKKLYPTNQTYIAIFSRSSSLL